MPQNPSAATSSGSSVGVNVLLVWALWQFWGINLPNEVAIALTGIVTMLFHFTLKLIENRYGVDLDGQPNHPQEPPK